jgi:hypothetical protein
MEPKIIKGYVPKKVLSHEGDLANTYTTFMTYKADNYTPAILLVSQDGEEPRVWTERVAPLELKIREAVEALEKSKGLLRAMVRDGEGVKTEFPFIDTTLASLRGVLTPKETGK